MRTTSFEKEKEDLLWKEYQELIDEIEVDEGDYTFQDFLRSYCNRGQVGIIGDEI